MHSSPPMRAPKLQLAVEQPSTRGHWNPPKKDTPHPVAKKKPQWDGRRGVITIKLNTILPGWVTYKLENNNTKELLTLLFSIPAVRLLYTCCLLAVHCFLEPDLSKTLLILEMATVRKVIRSPGLRSGLRAALEYDWAGSSRTGSGSLGVFRLGGIPAAAHPSPPHKGRNGTGQRGHEVVPCSRFYSWRGTEAGVQHPLSHISAPLSPHQDVAGLTDGLMVNSRRPAWPWLMSELRMCSGSDRTHFLIEQGHR